MCRIRSWADALNDGKKNSRTTNLPTNFNHDADHRLHCGCHPAFGVVMKEGPVGQAIFATVWVLVGIAWLEHLVRVKESASKE